ncbi:MAG: hypothetical protein EBR30_30750 [Cytophagia bacterium]|nr:hypothetical protein [Cytophagia bacterium]NBW39325.1 hypothetical protein [Cytophagia bacterium]
MKKTKVIRGAAQRYLNALWHLYSKAEPINNMNDVSIHHKISKSFGKILKENNYVRKQNGLYVYLKPDAPTIHDAKFILKKVRENSHLQPIKSLPQPMVKKRVKIEKQPNVWMYIAVISMFTTLITMALLLLR